MAEVTASGLVTASNVPGKVAIMVRYQGKTSVFNSAISTGFSGAIGATAKNFIDQLIFANLQELGIPPSPLCDDATFLRRASLDIAGRLPTLEETQAFMANTAADKRDHWIDQLLRQPEYATTSPTSGLRSSKIAATTPAILRRTLPFTLWVRDSLLANKPYDQFVRELLAATGTVMD